jgi:hypothetical protein
MLWHLCDAHGVSQRTCEAEDAFWATRRLAPIPYGSYVCSDASYRLGFVQVDVPPVCAKCFRNAPSEGYTKCEACRHQNRRAVARVKAVSPTKSHGQQVRRGRENLGWKQNVVQANVLRGIKQRKAKREATQ